MPEPGGREGAEAAGEQKLHVNPADGVFFPSPGGPSQSGEKQAAGDAQAGGRAGGRYQETAARASGAVLPPEPVLIRAAEIRAAARKATPQGEMPSSARLAALVMRPQSRAQSTALPAWPKPHTRSLLITVL